MKAQIISIGDELLIGQVVNSNAATIAQKLNSVGVDVARILTVGDDEKEIIAAFEASTEQFDVTAVTGGLGPTHDDITRKAVCEFFKTELVQDKGVLENIKSILKKRNFPWTKEAEDQAMVPRGAVVMPNLLGTAPGLMFELEGRFLFVMPGVPYEMEGMMEQFVVPYFAKRSTGTIIHRTLKTTGISETMLSNKLGDIPKLIEDATLAFLPSPTGVRLRISLRDTDRGRARQKVARIESEMRDAAGKYIYGVDDEELEQTVGKLLSDRNLTIAVAESLTGGLIMDRLTDVPGSSTYFMYGVVAYSDEAKTKILGVHPKLIKENGAVSGEVAEAMAKGVRSLKNTSIGVSTTGIAGPTGGSVVKPVGLTWIGFSTEQETFSMKFNFGDGRLRVKERASQAALDLVRRKVLGID